MRHTEASIRHILNVHPRAELKQVSWLRYRLTPYKYFPINPLSDMYCLQIINKDFTTNPPEKSRWLEIAPRSIIETKKARMRDGHDAKGEQTNE